MPIKKKSFKKKTATPNSLPFEPTMEATNPKDYIMSFFGPPGVGKTTFVNGLGRVLFLSTDRGTRFIKARRVECLDWKGMNKALDDLEKLPDASKHYDYVCIDHVADWANMAESFVLTKLNVDALTDAGYGKGWSMLKKEIYRFMERIKRLNLGIIFIAHEVIKTVKVRGIEVNKTMPLMSKQAWDAIIPLCDLVGYVGMRPVKQGGKRVELRTLETQPRQDLYAKDRTRRQKPAKEYELLTPDKFIGTFKPAA